MWLILEIIDLVKPKETTVRLNPVLWTGIVLMILFIIIKVQRWPLGGIVYMSGLFISSIGFFIEHSNAVKSKRSNT